MAFAARTVVYNPKFEKELQALKIDYLGIEEFVEGAEWVLSRNPKIGQSVGNDFSIWGLPIISGLKPVVIYYAFDDSTVWFLSIKAS